MQCNRWFIQGGAFAFAWCCLTALPAIGQADAASLPGDDYHPGDYGRVRYEENGLTIARGETGASWTYLSAGQVNTPIFRGDTLATGPNERAEAQLANATLVRIDQHSHLIFAAIPDPYPETLDETVLLLTQGGLRIEASLDEQKEFRIDTPGCRIYVNADTDLRVAVHGGRTRVATRRGTARVESGGSSLVLRAGMATEAVVDASPLGARAYNSFLTDEFDRWVSVRQSQSAANRSLTPAALAIREALPAQVQPYFRELSLHGMWFRNEHFGYAWVPQVPEEGWRPYRLGHWGYGQRGYFWISDEPWGWAPYHYGRWITLDNLGWAWVPGKVFAGAWVAWSWGPDHVGWAALDFWNLPARRYNFDDALFDPASWTLVAYENVGRRDLVDHHVPIMDDSEPESRYEVIATTLRDRPSIVTAGTAEETNGTRRSFLELEGGSERPLETAGQITATTGIVSADPDDLRLAEFQPANLNTPAAAKLQETQTGIVLKGRPTAMRPLVRFEQKGVAKVSEHWKVIYSTIAQPRPTQSPSYPPRSSPGETKVGIQPTSPAPTPGSSTREPGTKKRGDRNDRER